MVFVLLVEEMLVQGVGMYQMIMSMPLYHTQRHPHLERILLLFLKISYHQAHILYVYVTCKS